MSESEEKRKRVMVSVMGDTNGNVTQFLAELEKKDLFPEKIILLRVDPSPVVTLVSEIPVKEIPKRAFAHSEVTWPVVEQKKA